MGRGSITLYIMIIAGMGIVLSGWWYRNIWFKVEEAIEIYVNVFWICVCLLAALSIYGWRMHELLDTCNRTMEIQEGVIKDVVLIDTVTQYDDFDIYEVTLYGRAHRKGCVRNRIEKGNACKNRCVPVFILRNTCFQN